MAAAPLLALCASAAWGVSDFLGGVASRTTALAIVLVGSQVAGFAVFAVALTARDAAMPRDPRLMLGLLAGALAVVALGLIYAALRRGPVTVIAPIAAVAAAFPVLVGIARGDRVDAVVGAGLVWAFVGVVAASWSPGSGRPGRGALAAASMAAGAAISTGAVLVLINLSSRADAWWATGALRTGGIVASAGVFLAYYRSRLFSGSERERPKRLGPRRAIVAITAVGVFDALADISYASASRVGALSITAMLASLYPVATIALGAACYRERPTRLQLVGAALACIGVVALTSAAG